MLLYIALTHLRVERPSRCQIYHLHKYKHRDWVDYLPRPRDFHVEDSFRLPGKMADIAQCAAKMEYQEETRYPKNPFFMGPEAPCRYVDT